MTRTYLAKLHSAVAANKSGNYIEARELFGHLLPQGAYESCLSAANMTFKLGEVHAALAEYVRIHSLHIALDPAARLCWMQSTLGTEIAKHLGLPHSPTVTRTLRVPEDVGFGKSRWVCSSSRSQIGHAPLRSWRASRDCRPMCGQGRTTANAHARAACSRGSGERSREGRRIRAIERALDGASRLSASPVSLSGSATSDPGEAAATIQGAPRGKARAH